MDKLGVEGDEETSLLQEKPSTQDKFPPIPQGMLYHMYTLPSPLKVYY
jgi:hypothetical protein